MVSDAFKQQLLKNGKKIGKDDKDSKKEGKKESKKEENDDTESDSDFESLNLVAKSNHGKRMLTNGDINGKRRRIKQSNYLEEHLTIGEMAGLVPQSLLVNVDFERFSKENNFEPID